MESTQYKNYIIVIITFEKSKNISFHGRSLKMAVFSTRNLPTSTLLVFARTLSIYRTTLLSLEDTSKAISRLVKLT